MGECNARVPPYKRCRVSGPMKQVVLTELLFVVVMYLFVVSSVLTWIFFLEGTIARDRVPM